MKKDTTPDDNPTPGSPDMVYTEEIMINIEPEVVYIKQEPLCEEDIWNELESRGRDQEDVKEVPEPLAAPDFALMQEFNSILEKGLGVPNCSVILERIADEERGEGPAPAAPGGGGDAAKLGSLLEQPSELRNCAVRLERLADEVLGNLGQMDPQTSGLYALNGVSLRGRRRRRPRDWSPDSYASLTLSPASPTHTKPRKTHTYKPYAEKETLQQNTSLQDPKKLLPCHICHQKFRTYLILNNHIRVHTRERPFSCKFCTMNFTQRSALKRHERVHTGERPFSCPICKKNFIQSSNLKTHQRVHTGEKPFCCQICSKSFTHYSNLKLHERVHTKIPYSCIICKEQFTRSTDFESHKRVHTGEWPFSCEVCHKNFTRFCHLKNHERVHTQIDHCSVTL